MMAHELQRMGETTAFLALIDSYGPSNYLMSRRDRVASHCKALMRLPMRERKRYLEDRIKFRVKGTLPNSPYTSDGKHGKIRSPIVREGSESRAQFAQYFRQHQKDLFFDGEILLVVARDEAPEFLNIEREQGWGGFARQIDVLQAPGTHMTLLEEPHVAGTCAVFSPRLEAAQANTKY